jgi:hypothetical protein
MRKLLSCFSEKSFSFFLPDNYLVWQDLYALKALWSEGIFPSVGAWNLISAPV